MTPEREIEVVVVDDHSSLLRGLELLLPRFGLRVTGTAATFQEGARLVASRKPDVAVLDIGLGDDSGTELGNEIAALSDTATVLYTGCCDPEILAEAVGSGALGVVQKTSPVEDLARAIRAAAAGRAFVDTRIAELLPDRGAPPARAITKREAEVLGLIAAGLTVEEAAAELFLSQDTVQTHVRNSVRKLGARGRLHAVVLALRRGDLKVSGLAAQAEPERVPVVLAAGERYPEGGMGEAAGKVDA
jgi:DNA-binding NarL/FixJ family response regulator